MQRLINYLSTNGLKSLIVVKIMVLIGVLVSQLPGFSLGDLAVRAEDEKSEKDDGGVKSEEVVGKDLEKEAANTSRVSFLANLLDLPPLETESMKKEEIARYIDMAERKKQQIDERIEVLKDRESQLKGLEASIDGKIKTLDEERKYFAQTIQKEKDLKNERTEKLITMYAKMEPKKAAPVMEKLDKDLVIELFKQLPQKQVTAILEVMSADKSVELTEYYGRVRSAREYDILKEMNQSLKKEFDDCKGMPRAG